MEIIQSVDQVRGKRRIRFESGWQVWLNRNDNPGFSVSEGTQVDRDSFTEFILHQQYPSALDRAVRMLAERPCSKKEIEQRLNSAHFDKKVIELVMFKLQKEKLLDDLDFAGQWTMSRSRKYGKERIYRELRMKGIDTDTAESAIENISEKEEIMNAIAFASQKLHSLYGKCEPLKIKQRITSSLLHRGYSWEIATKAFEEALKQYE